jgi:hypothetical protein
MPDKYLVGQSVRLTLNLTDINNAAADPGALRLKLRSPAGTLIEYQYGVSGVVLRDGVGVFHADIPLQEPGHYLWRWESDAPNAGASEGVIAVSKSTVT